MNTYCFKIKEGTEFDKAVKQHFELLPKWNNVYGRVSELLGETITTLALDKETLCLDIDELQKDENKKLFKSNGQIKNNSKKAKEINEKYKQIVLEEGLQDYEDLRLIKFMYGVMRQQGQNLESFVTSEHDIFKGKSISCQADSIRKYIKQGRDKLMDDCSELIELMKK